MIVVGIERVGYFSRMKMHELRVPDRVAHGVERCVKKVTLFVEVIRTSDRHATECIEQMKMFIR